MDIYERLRRYEDRFDSEAINRLCQLNWLYASEAKGRFCALELEHDPQRILCRAHATHDPYVIGHYDTPEPLVHAAPWFVQSAMPKRYMSQEVYKNFLPDIGFVSFFLARPDQLYFPDDVLGEVMCGKRDWKGEVLGPGDAIGHRHFETNLHPERNPKLATLLFHRRTIMDSPYYAEMNQELEVWLNKRLCFSDKARKKLTRAVFKPEAQTL